MQQCATEGKYARQTADCSSSASLGSFGGLRSFAALAFKRDSRARWPSCSTCSYRLSQHHQNAKRLLEVSQLHHEDSKVGLVGSMGSMAAEARSYTPRRFGNRSQVGSMAAEARSHTPRRRVASEAIGYNSKRSVSSCKQSNSFKYHDE